MLSIIFRRIQWFAVIALAQLAAINATEVAAETAPVIGYVANENADAERLAAFKKWPHRSRLCRGNEFEDRVSLRQT
jgi:hypothetical protein